MENVTRTALGVMRVTIALAITGLVGTAIITPALAQEQDQTQDQAPANAKLGPRTKAQAGQRACKARIRAPPCSPLMATGKSSARRYRKARLLRARRPSSAAWCRPRRTKKQPQAQLTIIIVKQKEKDKIVPAMRVMAPLGVFLPTGIALEIDGAAVGRVPYARCTRQVCYATATASPDMFEKLRKGTAANFIIYRGPASACR